MTKSNDGEVVERLKLKRDVDSNTDWVLKIGEDGIVDFYNLVAINIPKITGNMGVPHAGKQRHIADDLLAMFGMRASELKIDNRELPTIGHHAVGAMFYHLPCKGMDRENDTLVEEL